MNFFTHGFHKGISDTGKEAWLINSPIVGYIDIEIEAAPLQLLRNSIEVHLATSVDEAISLIKSLNIPKNSWGSPLIFPYLEPSAKVLPGTRYGHRIEGKTIAETWVKIIHRIKTTGTIRPTGYDAKWQELIDLMAIITNEPEDYYFPEPNYLPLDREYLKNYLSQILDDAPYKEGVKLLMLNV